MSKFQCIVTPKHMDAHTTSSGVHSANLDCARIAVFDSVSLVVSKSPGTISRLHLHCNNRQTAASAPQLPRLAVQHHGTPPNSNRLQRHHPSALPSSFSCSPNRNSDKPGSHDFNFLKKLVLYDGSILRAKLPGRPTKDCLFSDPSRDGKSLLKIWNLNDYSGVLGVFNCQGARWCKVGKKNLIHDEQPGTVTGIIRSRDVGYLPKIAGDGWNGNAIIFSHLGGEVLYLPKNTSLPVTLKSREYEVFTVVPVKELSNGGSFAPIGLIKMFNSGGAVTDLRYEVDESAIVNMNVRGSGIFGAYSSSKPKRVTVDEAAVPFTYNEGTGLVCIDLKIPPVELYLWKITMEL